MASLPEPIVELLAALNKLPGIGPRSAERIALHLVQAESGAVKQLAETILNARERVRFCDTCGAYICRRIHDVFLPIQDSPEATHAQGVDFAVEQCRDLLDRGAPGLHFYSLNSVEPVRTIWRNLGL